MGKWVSAGLAVTLVLGVSVSALAFGTNKFEAEVKREQGAVKLLREVERGDYGVITAAELKQLMDKGEEMVIVDTMPYKASYLKGHLPGAVQFLFPIAEMEEWDSEETGGQDQAAYQALLGPDKERTVVVYCGFVKCTRSHNGAAWARRLGYGKVLRFPGGIFAWKGADYPVVSGK
ncbi:rhodanese-like domain-containing protein [Desulfogranum mediterraneum]|uniref:rhodanese-like domain-containing protein n=1 Tax=Desulfogranum mediterraneum TaxID=160661 RepID=UPI00048FFA6A